MHYQLFPYDFEMGSKLGISPSLSNHHSPKILAPITESVEGVEGVEIMANCPIRLDRLLLGWGNSRDETAGQDIQNILLLSNLRKVSYAFNFMM